MMGEPKVYMPVGEDARDEGEMMPMANKTKEKGNLSMDPMVESSWQSKEYSTPVEETVLLVGKFVGMPSTTLRCFAPQAIGVCQMKLKASPQYSGKRHPWVRV